MSEIAENFIALYEWEYCDFDFPLDFDWKDLYDKVRQAEPTPENLAIMAFLYHEGLVVEKDLEKCFELVERAIDEGGDSLAYYLLGYMCDHAETPDQAEGGERQKYDHYDAERFYEICAKYDTYWGVLAHVWLGEYFMDSARGGDPEIGVDYYKAVAGKNGDAAAALSDYYWDLVMPDALDDEEWGRELFKSTQVAVLWYPEEYAYLLGWLYLDGIGCEPDRKEAKTFFCIADQNGDWRGMKTYAEMLEEEAKEYSQKGEEDLAEAVRFQIEQCRERSEFLKAKSDDEEMDNSQEED